MPTPKASKSTTKKLVGERSPAARQAEIPSSDNGLRVEERAGRDRSRPFNGQTICYLYRYVMRPRVRS
jgi:hypothetical protein